MVAAQGSGDGCISVDKLSLSLVSRSHGESGDGGCSGGCNDETHWRCAREKMMTVIAVIVEAATAAVVVVVEALMLVIVFIPRNEKNNNAHRRCVGRQK